ncbi:amidase [Mycobacterium intracellulare]|uniref:amidase n=1 Tax=Mycobacterium intracellulare (strain ATCC 13950 / DSM 43223 / JCM 6384 / NCTC 13025 / 3600) TaxID=487521 RepID=H8IHZ4_MYCIA|nr:amidase [Mycobacterium intracellulare]AFC44801.1 amidase [Mycobacterium intracellulare ATCC 13950]ETZ33397.1 amidase family protein [Mycobacterium intracellulare MIN_061107_1834]MCA2250965.1 amidase [Mycobacterium intracellulare]MCA2358112.1 amidase [Mycobacterium intracellulare]MCA2365441.1 amidase [Mycobacterium intracellulare]
MRHVHAFGDDALGDLDAVGLAEAIRSGRVGRAEAVETAIARTEAVDPALNGLAYAGFRQARAAAEQAADGYFSGVPTFIKDNVDVAGQPTMHGTDAWTRRDAVADSVFTQLYLATGMTSLGKTQLSEFGFSASAEHPRLGPVRNPWDTEYSAGASSSGSGAFVAAGVVPIAHANDGGGSIRIPASCNGLVGLKPSRGRLPLDAVLRRMPVGVVVNGVVTRSVRDTAAFYREAERIWRNPKLAPVGDVTGPGRQRLRIAVLTRSIQRECSPAVRELTLKSAGLLEELGHRVEHVDEPPVAASFVDDFVLYWGFLALAQVRGGRHMFGETFDRAKLDCLTLGLMRHTGRHLHRLPAAIMRLRGARRRTARFYGTYDAVLTPTLADETPRIGFLAPTDYQQVLNRLIEWVSFTPLHNVTGEPAISLPLAQSAHGMPVGMMLSTGMGQESLLLELAYELEEARPWARIQAG